MNPYHDAHGHFSKRPIDLGIFFTWLGALIFGVSILVLAVIGLETMIKKWNPTETVATEDEFVRANKSDLWVKPSINGKSEIVPVQITLEKGCFSGESLDEIVRMIQAGDNVSAIRKLTGRKP